MRGSVCSYPSWIHLLVAAALMRELVVRAQDWQTVDDFALAGGDAEARGVAVDAVGRIYVIGTANGHGIVRSSADGGTTWSTREDFVYPSETNNAAGTNNLFNAITINPQGDLFVGGASAAFVGGVSAGHWIVRRSRDQGVSWETVDDFWQPMNGPEPGTNAAVYSLSSDGQGRVYGAGLMHPTGPSYNYWWVRGSGIGSTNWDSKLLLSSVYDQVSQITWAGEDVYVTGSVSGEESFSGLILKSSDFGATWTTNFAAPHESYNAITSDSAGNVYSAGNRSVSNVVDWLVRKEAPGGTNWTILDRATYEGDLGSGIDHPEPSSIAIDAAGNMCVTGRFLDFYFYGTNGAGYGGANWTWFTRQYSAATGQWNTTDLFCYSTNKYGVANGTAILPDGGTFVVGYGTSDSGQRRWVVRKQAAPINMPQLQIAIGGGGVAVSWPVGYTNSILEWTDSCRTNQLWQTFTGTVRVVDGRATATCELTSGGRFFRLRSTANN